MYVLWKRLFSKDSGRDKATLFQLRNLLNRSSVPSDPVKNMKASEDFLLVILHAHVVAAANTICSHMDVNSVQKLSHAIVANYTLLPQLAEASSNDYPDKVYLYAMEFLTLALVWHGFHDAIKEGDGNRILHYWKFLLIIFKSSRNYNYAKDAVNLLLSHGYLLSDRKAAQLLWSRTINIPMDLHMEHLNRTLKSILSTGRYQPKAIVKAAKSVRTIHKVCEVFKKETSDASTSDKNPYPAFTKDFNEVLGVLEEMKVFNPLEKRQHSCFSWISGTY